MGIAIRFSAFRQAHRRDGRPILTCLACHLKTQIDNGRVSLLDPYEGVLQQFSLLDKAEAEGAHLRVRVRLGRRGGDVFTLLPDARALEGVGWLDFGYLSPRWFSAHRPFLYHMAHMGLGQSFISWVRLLYTEIRSAIMINGYTSDSFWPSQGVRQGCPLSPLLYVISIEVLAANLRAHPDIVGLRPPSLSCSLPVMSLYTDDTTVVACSFAAIHAVFVVYGVFEKGSGSRLNLGKCEGLWLGTWRFQTCALPVDISWSFSKIKILGVYIGQGDLSESNWRPRLDAVARCFKSWRS